MSQITKKLLVVTGVFSIIFILSCKHEPFPGPTPLNKTVDTSTTHPVDTTHKDTVTRVTGSPCSKDTVYFTNTILPLIISSCASPHCHDATTHHSGYTLTSYSGIMRLVVSGNPNSSKLYTILSATKKRMPPAGPLSATQKNDIYTWILQGAKQNTCTDNSTCDSTNVKYSVNIAAIMSGNCTGCHSASIASGGITLDTYSGVAAVGQNGQLMGGILGTLARMPQTGNPLSSCDIAKIRKWISDGMPNN